MKKHSVGIFFLVISLCLPLVLAACGNGDGDDGQDQKTFLYVANDIARHVAVFELDMDTGDLAPVGKADTPSGRPHHLMVNPDGTRLYASLFTTHDVAGFVAGFVIDPADGTLSAIPGSPWAASDYPAMGAFDPSGDYFFMANYDSNNITGYSVDPDTGALTALSDAPFMTSDYPYGAVLAPNGYLYVAVSSTNSIAAYMMSPSTGSLTAAPSASAAASDEPYQLIVAPDGRHLYIANYGAANIGAYAISTSTGALTALSGSPFATSGNPWSIAMDPLGRFLYAASEKIQGFVINGDGTLSPLSGPATAFSQTVDGLSVDPSGTFLLSAHTTDNLLWIHRIDPVDGTLSAGQNSPFAMSDPYNAVAVRIIP